MDDIEIIDPPQKPVYCEELIHAAFKNKTHSANYNTRFSGRPTTKIIEFENNILKLKTEYRLPIDQARKYVLKTIDREKVLGVHHPDKTWFLRTSEDELKGSEVIIGNITPYLTTLLDINNKLDLFDENMFAYLIGDIVGSYLKIAAKYEFALDLCLSNFGINDQIQCFYVDDDLYPWDRFASLPHFLAKIIRSMPWLNEKTINLIGKTVRTNIIESFIDKHWVTVIAEELRNCYFSSECDALRNALIYSLYSDQVFNYNPRETKPVIALISDIHGNAPALETALSYIQSRSISSAIVLGDIVGYGPHPSQCIDILKSQQQWSIICGNHDHAVASGIMPLGITAIAQWALNWTIENISQSEKNWLGGLPAYLKHDDWLAVHGAPNDKSFFNAYVYHMTYIENLDELERRGIRHCFHGHTHIQKIYYRQDGKDCASEESQKSYKFCHALINPGSIGQPRCGKTGVELAVIDLDSHELEFIRLKYKMDSLINDMRGASFPTALVNRMLVGK